VHRVAESEGTIESRHLNTDYAGSARFLPPICRQIMRADLARFLLPILRQVMQQALLAFC